MTITPIAPPRSRTAGFTLIELMLVVTIVGILAAIAIPSLIAARGAAYETSTIGSLRAIQSAQTLFAGACGGGYYAPSMVSLATKPAGSKAPFIGPEFASDTVVRQNYTIRYTAGTAAAAAPATCNGVAAGQAVDTYFVGADLIVTSYGMSRYFGVNAGSVIFQSTIRVPVTLTGAPAAPAKPLG